MSSSKSTLPSVALRTRNYEGYGQESYIVLRRKNSIHVFPAIYEERLVSIATRMVQSVGKPQLIARIKKQSMITYLGSRPDSAMNDRDTYTQADQFHHVTKLRQIEARQGNEKRPGR